MIAGRRKSGKGVGSAKEYGVPAKSKAPSEPAGGKTVGKTKPTANPQVLQITTDKSPEQVLSQLAAEGVFANAGSILYFTKPNNGHYCDIGEAVELLRQSINASMQGDSNLSDRLLVSQALSLNAMFNEMARRAALNMGEHLGATETYLRLALKAQSQCRATLESLAKIKNPPNVTFVKQANVAQGHQQINNGVPAPEAAHSARTGKAGSAPIELLEENHGEWVVPGTAGEAVRSDQKMEAMGAIDRPQDKRRKAAR